MSCASGDEDACIICDGEKNRVLEGVTPTKCVCEYGYFENSYLIYISIIFKQCLKILLVLNAQTMLKTV